jgi:hypothetical protein
MSKSEKDAILASERCYVCADLGVDHAGFDGYDARHVHMDHYQIPFGTPGGAKTEVLPIHAAPGGSVVDDDDFESSTYRNCHKLRRDDFITRGDYVRELRVRLTARGVRYVDEVSDNLGRTPSSAQYSLPVSWSGSKATFMGKDYPVVTEVRNGTTWRRFLTTLKPGLIFTDHTSQVRPADKNALMKMVHTFLGEGFPMFSAVNARVDKCGHIVIFDGNHRATAHAVVFGVNDAMPVTIWDIEPGDGCALVQTAAKKTALKKTVKKTAPKKTVKKTAPKKTVKKTATMKAAR